jgi:hypothetical protein
MVETTAVGLQRPRAFSRASTRRPIRVPKDAFEGGKALSMPPDANKLRFVGTPARQHPRSGTSVVAVAR